MNQGVDFSSLADALLARAKSLVPEWLPGGTTRGDEYVCGDLAGGKGDSCSVNLRTGKWADFAADQRGGDLISLYAAVRGMNNGQAARELARDLGLQPFPVPPAPGRSDSKPAKSQWRPIVPVPEAAPEPDFKHFHHEAPERAWAYRFGGRLYGHVVRFKKSDGGKEIMPHTWCVDENDPRGTQRWAWKQWEEPRPLYVSAGELVDGRTVVLVEGEKCAEAGASLSDLTSEFDWVSWPGGSKAWHKASWSWLAGRTVVLWPDCDSKRLSLTPHEKQQAVDPESKPFLNAEKQPGLAAMLGIARLLAQEHGCRVSMCQIPAPGEVPDGWDVADAIEQGWDAQQVREFLEQAAPFVGSPANDEPSSTPPSAGAGRADRPPTWRDGLLRTDKGAVQPVRENVVIALEGLPEQGILGADGADGVIAYNEFTNDVIKMRDAPWGTPAGLWAEVDELKMGEWLARKHHLPSMPRGTLEEAVRIVAYNHRFHPVRAWLDGLEWDGQRRLHTWLCQACLDEDEWDLRVPLYGYLARVGTFFLQGMCARVMEPGVKFDWMLILEGRQGMRKSTLLRVLAGEYFADTGLDLSNKDSYQQLQGRWLYEFAELDSFGKAEVTKIKSFIASASDYFRASFDRRARDYPRQIVFGGTTNEENYLTDPTGNRRFWPVRVTRPIDVEWVQSVREQLFAEAMHRLRSGARMYPTMEEERELFEPQQQERAVENVMETAVSRFLYDSPDGSMLDEITLGDLLSKIGIGIEKIGPGQFHQKQAAAALRRLGWVQVRSSKPGRPRAYRRPNGGADAVAEFRGATQHLQPEGADSDCPF